MRIVVEVDGQQLEALLTEAKRANSSPSEVIRKAISRYLQDREPRSLDAAFGTWADEAKDGLDGLTFQEKLRNEW